MKEETSKKWKAQNMVQWMKYATPRGDQSLPNPKDE